MQLGDLRVCSPTTAPVDQFPQDRDSSSSMTGAQPRHAGADQRDGVRVGGVGLAVLDRW